MDIVSDLMRSVGMTPVLLAQSTIPKPWGMSYPPMRGAAFHLIVRGAGYLRSAQLPAPIRLECGDLVLVTRQIAYELASDLNATAKPLAETLTMARRGPPPQGEAVNDTSLMCGIFRFALEPIHPFFAELPPLIHIPAHQIAAHEPMYAAQRLLSAELDYANTEPAKSILTDRLVDVMFYYILRQWVNNNHAPGASWVKAYHDPHVRRALVAMHENPAYTWRVAELAQKADLSRSAFAQRFKELLGDTPVNYLTRLRIQKSMELLVRTDESIERISETVGFGTGFALSKAFKRVTGQSPRDYRVHALQGFGANLSPFSKVDLPIRTT